MRLLLVLVATSLAAAQLPDSPSFAALSAVNAAATGADAYTTTWIRPRWLATPRTVDGPCLGESSAWLYGKEPTRSRAYSAAAAGLAASEMLAWLLRRKRYWWQAALLTPTAMHAVGAIHNWRVCR